MTRPRRARWLRSTVVPFALALGIAGCGSGDVDPATIKLLPADTARGKTFWMKQTPARKVVLARYCIATESSRRVAQGRKRPTWPDPEKIAAQINQNFAEIQPVNNTIQAACRHELWRGPTPREEAAPVEEVVVEESRFTESQVVRLVGLRLLPHAQSDGSADDGARWSSPEGCLVDWVALDLDLEEARADDVRDRVVYNPDRDVALVISGKNDQTGARLRRCKTALRDRLRAVR